MVNGILDLLPLQHYFLRVLLVVEVLLLFGFKHQSLLLCPIFCELEPVLIFLRLCGAIVFLNVNPLLVLLIIDFLNELGSLESDFNSSLILHLVPIQLLDLGLNH